MNLSNQQKNLLHEHYLTMRKMLSSGFSKRGVQKSFEELVYTVMEKNCWRPTHISQNAVKYCIENWNTRSKGVQRAHGMLSDRMDRFDRTMFLLQTECLSFDQWWEFFTYHDKTILVERTEHSKNILSEDLKLIELPPWSEDMFFSSGFSVSLRKKSEGAWLENAYKQSFSQNVV
jgi:hypothetical protein